MHWPKKAVHSASNTVLSVGGIIKCEGENLVF